MEEAARNLLKSPCAASSVGDLSVRRLLALTPFQTFQILPPKTRINQESWERLEKDGVVIPEKVQVHSIRHYNVAPHRDVHVQLRGWMFCAREP